MQGDELGHRSSSVVPVGECRQEELIEQQQLSSGTLHRMRLVHEPLPYEVSEESSEQLLLECDRIPRERVQWLRALQFGLHVFHLYQQVVQW